MLDGLITADSNPLTEEETEILRKEDEEILERTKNVKEKKPSMSLFTSFGLSLKNLFTKMGRTALTSFAGSIGIIGIALIYAVSNGMTTYIDIVQEETLSSYPLSLQAQTYDLTSIMQTVMDMSTGESTHEKDAVYEKSIVYELVQAISGIETSENDLGAFKEYLDKKLADTSESGNPLKNSISGVSYSYDLRLKLFTKNIDGKINQVDPTGLMQKLITGSSSAGGAGAFDSTGASYAALMGGGGFTTWQEILPGLDGDLVSETVKKQYDVVYGSWPKAYDEVVVVLDKESELPDMTLYALGLISESEMKERMKNAQKEDADHTVETHKWTYEEICSREYVTVLPSSYYTLDEETGELTDLSATEAGLLHLYNNGIKFKVVGVLCPKEDALSPMLSGAIAYTAELKEYVIEQAKLSQTVKLQEDNKNVDIFTGLLFKKNVNAMTDKEMATDFKDYVKNLSAEKKTAIYLKMTSMPSDEFIAELVQTEVDSKSVEEIKTILVNYMAATQGAPSSMIEMYINQMPEAEIIGYYKQMVEAQIREEYKKAAENATNDKTPEQTAALFDTMVANSTEEELAYYYQNCLTFSSANYENNLTKLGALDLEKPRSINLYAVSFDDKDVIVDEIKAYNEQMEDVKKISYTDYVGLLMSSVNTIIDAITYVLIAFVSISLIVSSIMIGVITLISVQERTKEIGILRAIGASKANVSSMFNAETVIIGFTSGLLGVLITYVLCVPINLILNALTGIGNLKAILPAEVGLLLILISVFLTLIAGIIPSRSAAKKDPVVALRTE